MATTVTLTSTNDEKQQQQQQQKQPHLDLNGNPFEVPDFTMKEIYAAIPAHCFKASTIHSLLYVARDISYLAIILALSLRLVPLLPHASLRIAGWAVATFLLGLPGVGLWILAHECGHGAFSSSKRLNHAAGLVLHSFLLVPFHSWRLSHSQHHKATGNLAKDTVFIPHTRDSYVKLIHGPAADPQLARFQEMVEDAPMVHLWNCLVHQLIGWPGYLLLNLTGQQYSERGDIGWWTRTHFWAGESSVFYRKEDLGYIVQSDLGILALFAGLAAVGAKWGAWYPLVLWGVPWLWVNCWIGELLPFLRWMRRLTVTVAITFLQHSDPTLPHFDGSIWSFPMGATATIDRDLGFLDTHFFHSIVSTHVLHHLISSIPFYHAHEATACIRKVMGRHYRSDFDTPFWTAFWRNQRSCKFVEETEGREGDGVFMYRNLYTIKGETPARRYDEQDDIAVVDDRSLPVSSVAAMHSTAMEKVEVHRRRLSQSVQSGFPMLAE